MKPQRIQTAPFLFILAFMTGLWAQVAPRDQIDAFFANGDLDMAEKTIDTLLAKPQELGYQDSVYLLKDLGVIYASNPEKQAKADTLFEMLLTLDPFASLYDTYASNAIMARFQKIRKSYQSRKGGKALVPPVVVFDFEGFGFTPQERVSLTNQFIAEMGKIPIFHTFDRPSVSETLNRLHKQPGSCEDRDCRLDIARRFMAEYMVMGEVARIDSVYTFQLAFVSVETGQNSTVLRKVYTGSLADVLATGLPDLALALQDQEAAWLNLSLQPTHTNLSLDGSPLETSASRFPVNPGKHSVCGNSPGYQTLCKDFEVKKMDAVTYSLVLPKLGGENNSQALGAPRPNWDEDSRDPAEESTSGKGPSKKMIAFIVGGMAVLAAGLAFLWSAK